MADRTKLYEFLIETVIEECGDGDAVIISENYEQYANEFDIWQKENGYNWDKFKKSAADYIVFYNNQEEIIFCNTKEGKDIPTWMFTKIYLY